MKTKVEAFAGLSVAVVTPFTNGHVDYKVFRGQFEFQFAAVCRCKRRLAGVSGDAGLQRKYHQVVDA